MEFHSFVVCMSGYLLPHDVVIIANNKLNDRKNKMFSVVSEEIYFIQITNSCY